MEEAIRGLLRLWSIGLFVTVCGKVFHSTWACTARWSFRANISSFPSLYILHIDSLVITTYEGIRVHKDILLDRHWHYIVLDEGQKIKNPDSSATLLCKQFLVGQRGRLDTERVG